MRSTLFFVLGLLVIANAAQQPNVFAQLDQHPFGSSLLDLVQINMQSNAQAEIKSEDSINQISDLLNEIQADMQKTKKVADQEHKSFQEKADYDIAQYKKVIAEQKQRLALTLKQLAADKKQLKETQDDLKQAQAHLASVNSQIEAADAENTRAVAAFEKKVKELNDAIAACKEANVELGKLGVVEFAQVKQNSFVQVDMSSVELALKQHLPTRLAIYRPIITALAEMGTNANPELVAKVVGLINELRQALEAELLSTQKNEKVRVADYVKLRADLVVDQRATEKRIGRNQVLIQQLNKAIKQNTAIAAELNKTIPAAEKLLAIREQQKADEQAAYEKDNASRESELEVIAQLIKYFDEKFSKSMSTYLRDRVAKY